LSQTVYQSISQNLSCAHCEQETSAPVFAAADGKSETPFCCVGCMTVYSLLHSKGLSSFYQLKKETPAFAVATAVEVSTETYSYMDQEEFLEDFTDNGDHSLSMSFYLEGIHCVACLWLIEKLSEIDPNIKFSHLNLATSVATVTLEKNGRLSQVAQTLSLLGFKPHPLKKGLGHEEHQKREDRKDLSRIGVAAAAAMNIMLYSISVYAGAPESVSHIFGVIILIFALPVMLYSAFPFYHSAWSALKQRKISLDLPISIALIYGTMRGFYESISGGEEYYFDTLTVLVFLLLLSRFAVKKWGQRGLAVNALSSFLGQSAVSVKKGESWHEIYPDYLAVGDVVKMKTNQMLPTDGILINDQVFLQTALMSGEARPKSFQIGEQVLAGFQNTQHEFLYRVTAVKEQSQLGKIFQQLNQSQKSDSFYSHLADRVASRLVAIVLFLSVALIVYFAFQGNFTEGERRAFSLIIITCPCALGLATPLALVRSLGLAHRLGIVLKSEQLLEKISQIKVLLLDKTGTLTKGKFGLLSKNTNEYDDITVALEKNSQHPIAQALVKVLPESSLEMENVTETLGHGVEGEIGKDHYFIGSSKSQAEELAGISISLYKNGDEVATYVLGDEIQEETYRVIEELQAHGYETWILSGDKRENVERLGQKLKIPMRQLRAELLPIDKAIIVKELNPAMMIGDGANDSLALRQASIGAAVKGSMALSLKSCDLYLTKPGLQSLWDLLQLSKGTLTIIKRNLRFSLAYNILGTSLAVTGMIDPLGAAILMPLSSLTVVASTLWGDAGLRKLNAKTLQGRI